MLVWLHIWANHTTCHACNERPESLLGEELLWIVPDTEDHDSEIGRWRFERSSIGCLHIFYLLSDSCAGMLQPGELLICDTQGLQREDSLIPANAGDGLII